MRVGTQEWLERYPPVDGDPTLAGGRSFARLFVPESGVADAALLVAGATAYLVRPCEQPRLVLAADDVELLFGALDDVLPERTPGEWREVPDFVARALLATADWVAMTACLRRG